MSPGSASDVPTPIASASAGSAISVGLSSAPELPTAATAKCPPPRPGAPATTSQRSVVAAARDGPDPHSDAVAASAFPSFSADPSPSGSPAPLSSTRDDSTSPSGLTSSAITCPADPDSASDPTSTDAADTDTTPPADSPCDGGIASTDAPKNCALPAGRDSRENCSRYGTPPGLSTPTHAAYTLETSNSPIATSVTRIADPGSSPRVDDTSTADSDTCEASTSGQPISAWARAVPLITASTRRLGPDDADDSERRSAGGAPDGDADADGVGARPWLPADGPSRAMNGRARPAAEPAVNPATATSPPHPSQSTSPRWATAVPNRAPSLTPTPQHGAAKTGPPTVDTSAPATPGEGVAVGVGTAVAAVGVVEAVGEAVTDAVGEAVGVDVDVSVGEGVALGVGAAEGLWLGATCEVVNAMLETRPWSRPLPAELWVATWTLVFAATRPLPKSSSTARGTLT
mmetsp:Transcript_3614/g.15032  ORF Transcript_3614/g.15032 Transcript_3614/m.15032 type:complete len:460 (+) Transcript_3614:60-1439(+)